VLDIDKFGEENDPFEQPGFMDKFMGTITDEQFKETAKQWGKGAATVTVLTLVSYTVRFLGGKITPRGEEE
jgi:hypothetical protein